MCECKGLGVGSEVGKGAVPPTHSLSIQATETLVYRPGSQECRPDSSLGLCRAGWVKPPNPVGPFSDACLPCPGSCLQHTGLG